MAAEPIHVTDEAFERAVLQADHPVIAIFWAREDDRAEQLREVAVTIAHIYASEARIVLLESGDVPQTRARYEVDRLPQFLFFRQGKLVARARGLPTEAALRPWVAYLLERGPRPAGSGPRSDAAPPAQPITVTDADFNGQVLGASRPVLVDFWAGWCAPCRMVGPVVERLAAEFAGRVKVAKLDVDANQQTAQQYGVMSIPTLIFFKDGQEVGRLTGVQPEGVLRERLAALL